MEGTKQAILGDDLPLGIDATNTTNETLKTITVDLIEQIENAPDLPTGYSSSVDGPCGGSADYTSIVSGNTVSRIDIHYRSYCSSGMTINGLVKFYYNYSGSTISGYKIVYSNVTITGNGYNETINMTIDCNASYDCTYSSTTTGSDGRTYNVSGSTVLGIAVVVTMRRQQLLTLITEQSSSPRPILLFVRMAILVLVKLKSPIVLVILCSALPFQTAPKWLWFITGPAQLTISNLHAVLLFV